MNGLEHLVVLLDQVLNSVLLLEVFDKLRHLPALEVVRHRLLEFLRVVFLPVSKDRLFLLKDFSES